MFILNVCIQCDSRLLLHPLHQFSNGGGAFMAGKGIKNDKQKAAVLGSVAGAQHVRLMAKHYGVPVVLHSGKFLRAEYKR